MDPITFGWGIISTATSDLLAWFPNHDNANKYATSLKINVKVVTAVLQGYIHLEEPYKVTYSDPSTYGHKKVDPWTGGEG